MWRAGLQQNTITLIWVEVFSTLDIAFYGANGTQNW